MGKTKQNKTKTGNLDLKRHIKTFWKLICWFCVIGINFSFGFILKTS